MFIGVWVFYYGCRLWMLIRLVLGMSLAYVGYIYVILLCRSLLVCIHVYYLGCGCMIDITSVGLMLILYDYGVSGLWALLVAIDT